ncbi:MAG: trypsin-like peptidase domain-containing protein [Patescibacteria group bacterium]
MKYLYLPLLILSFVASPVHAASSVEDATVNLYCRLKSGNTTYSTSGSGVFVSDRGVILTNAHVAQYFLLAGEKGRVRGTCTVRTGSPAKDTYTASLLYLSPLWIEANVAEFKKKIPTGTGEGDFALLYVTGAVKGGTLPPTFPYITPSFLYATEGESVTIAGYPTENRNFKEIQRELPRLVTTSTITSVRSFTPSTSAEVLTIASSSAASAGVSGGPVVKSDGTLAGIVSTKGGSLLRAVSVSHMNTKLMSETGMTLSGMLIGDLAMRAQTNRALITPKQVIGLRDGLLRKR